MLSYSYRGRRAGLCSLGRGFSKSTSVVVSGEEGLQEKGALGCQMLLFLSVR